MWDIDCPWNRRKYQLYYLDNSDIPTLNSWKLFQGEKTDLSLKALWMHTYAVVPQPDPCMTRENGETVKEISVEKGGK